MHSVALGKVFQTICVDISFVTVESEHILVGETQSIQFECDTLQGWSQQGECHQTVP